LTRESVNKSTDAELHRLAGLAAKKHGAIFLGPARTYKYGSFQLADGRQIDIHLYHVRDGKWPTDVDQYLARQAQSRGRNLDRMQARLHELAQTGGARLLDPQWVGPHHWYSFELSDGRVVKIRGSKLVSSGWPKDVDAYIEWSKARRQSGAGARTRDELFAEFKAEVERNNAVVLTKEWLGARTLHEVLLSDGTIRRIKPNQLKYFGWPAVPLDELRKMAAPYPVHILPSTASKETQIFRIVVSGGVYLQGSFADLKLQWSEGVADCVAEGVEWAERVGLRIVPAKWEGVLASYEFSDMEGNIVLHKLPAAAAQEQKQLNDAELAKLRRIGTMHGVKLLSDTFLGKDARYHWERDGRIFDASSMELIQASRHQAKLDALRNRVRELGIDAELLSSEWAGMCAAYRWRWGGEEVVAKLSQLRLMARKGAAAKPSLSRSDEAKVFRTGAGERALEVLRDWADGVGIKLLSTNWVDQGANYEWALPDGSVVAASLKKVRNCTRAVLRQRGNDEVDLEDEMTVLRPEECPVLVEKISTSKSR
jgi:hypothetical protein